MRNLSQWGAVCSLDFVLKQAVNGFLKQKAMSERGLPRMPYRNVFSKIKAFLKSKNIMDYKTTLKSLRSVYKLSQRKKQSLKPIIAIDARDHWLWGIPELVNSDIFSNTFGRADWHNGYCKIVGRIVAILFWNFSNIPSKSIAFLYCKYLKKQTKKCQFEKLRSFVDGIFKIHLRTHMQQHRSYDGGVEHHKSCTTNTVPFEGQHD